MPVAERDGFAGSAARNKCCACWDHVDPQPDQVGTVREAIQTSLRQFAGEDSAKIVDQDECAQVF